MQMRIHRFPLIFILLTQTHILYFIPFTGQRLTITVLNPIKAMFFNVIKQTYSIFKRFCVSRSPAIFTQSIDSKT